MSEKLPFTFSGNQGLTRKRVKLYSILMPFFLIFLFMALYIVYYLSSKWASTTDNNLKMLFGIGGAIFSILGIFIGLSLLVFVSWVLRGKVPRINLSSIVEYPLILLPNVPFKRRMHFLLFGIPLILIDIGIITVVASFVFVNSLMAKEILSSIPNLLEYGVMTIILGIFSLYWLFLHISFLHWIVTGRIINSIEQGRDWSYKP